MKRHARAAALLALALMAAAPAGAPDDRVREGTAALARRDFDAALQSFAAAEERTTDPGLVAFDEGVAFYHRGDFALAERHFRQCLEDAAGPRRARALYNLAACLVQQAGERDARRLAAAADLYEECLRQEGADAPLAGAARHNLELTKLLWVLARARADEHKDNPDAPDDDPAKPPPRSQESSGSQAEAGLGNPQGAGKQTPVGPDGGKNPGEADQQPLPGEGSLQAIPDKDDLVPMSPEEAARHLQQAVDEVLKERRAYRQRTMKVPSGKVLDW
jgi:tetratricopeptide (TPR) repeat protein